MKKKILNWNKKQKDAYMRLPEKASRVAFTRNLINIETNQVKKGCKSVWGGKFARMRTRPAFIPDNREMNVTCFSILAKF